MIEKFPDPSIKQNKGVLMVSDSIEELSALLPIDTVGLCPPETIIVPVVGILLVLIIGIFALKLVKRLS